MERYGNLETVNGKTGSAIEPLIFQRGELHKLRFINASTAAVHTVRITGHTFRITHTDGHPLSAPYETDMLVLQPSERMDVEVAAVGNPGSEWTITSDRPDLGIRIPIIYKDVAQAQVPSPFVPPLSRALAGIRERVPDAVLDLNSTASMTGNAESGGPTMSIGEMSGMSMGGGANGMTRWTINGRSFPDTEPVLVKTGEVVKIRLQNSDTQAMHSMDHPIHVHGTYFQVVSLNGKDPARETWKDTINVPAGQFVDIAFIMKNPGQWMLHCHIIDHEDGGMITMIEARA